MRLWHKGMIPYLPDRWLIGLWAACNVVLKECLKPNPKLDYASRVPDYPTSHFRSYGHLVMNEIKKRGIKTRKSYFFYQLSDLFDKEGAPIVPYEKIWNNWHNARYAAQCYRIVQEKYDCGMLPAEDWEKIERWYENEEKDSP